jgi:hypothetical protein
MAMTRMAPSSEYLLFEDQPAMKSTIVVTEVTAIMYSTPTLRSMNVMPFPKGNTPQTRRAGANARIGANMKTTGSLARGIRASFCISLVMSAMGWRGPGPAVRSRRT